MLPSRAVGRWFMVLYGWFGVWITVALVKQLLFVHGGTGIMFGDLFYLIIGLVPAFIFALLASLVRNDLGDNEDLYRFLLVCSVLIGIILGLFQPIDYLPPEP